MASQKLVYFLVLLRLALYEEKSKGQSTKDLKWWLDIRVVRSMLVDFPLWICFGIACLKTLQSVE
jgi:hypothetical protein